MLKHLLIKHLAFISLWASQISIQIIIISDLGDSLMIHSFNTKHILLKICVDCYESKLKELSNETTLVLSNTRELDRVPSTK